MRDDRNYFLALVLGALCTVVGAFADDPVAMWAGGFLFGAGMVAIDRKYKINAEADKDA